MKDKYLFEQHEAEFVDRLMHDFKFYAAEFLKILDKGGRLIPFKLNFAQEYLHEAAEKQLQQEGRVRLLILKGRQQGISTYIQGRFFHKVSTNVGKQAFILTHDMKATNNLFNITKRFSDNFEGNLRHKLSNNSKCELRFKGIDSGYKVGTAGNKETGRSATINLFHGSESAFWENSSQLVKGVFQTIPEEDGTEVFIESTANGMNNWFYEEWLKASKGNSAFKTIFIPWYWDKGYAIAIPSEADFILDKVEKDLLQKHKLTYEQILWRRRKIDMFATTTSRSKGIEDFNQEYPESDIAAFMSGIKTGRVFNVNEDEFLIKPFAIPEFWPRVNGLDFGWHPDPTVLVNLAYDFENDILYLVSEYGALERTPQQHVFYLNERGLDKYNTICDPFGGMQSSIKDGSTLLEIYNNCGLNVTPAKRTGVYSGCMIIKERMVTKRLKIFSNCNAVINEIRHYVYDDKTGQPKDKNNHYIDALRYVVVSGMELFLSNDQTSVKKLHNFNKTNPWEI